MGLIGTKKVTYVWIILSAITILSWWLGTEHTGRALHSNVVITIAVLAMGLFKVRLIIRNFMEVRTAPPWLRHGTDAWLVALGATLLAIYLA